jgi:hypothetical protein
MLVDVAKRDVLYQAMDGHYARCRYQRTGLRCVSVAGLDPVPLAAKASHSGMTPRFWRNLEVQPAVSSRHLPLSKIAEIETLISRHEWVLNTHTCKRLSRIQIFRHDPIGTALQG